MAARKKKAGLSKPATLSDVAALAGVSVPTASRVLNVGVRGPRSGSEEIRGKVLAAAHKLGYTPSSAAQTMKLGQSRTVGVLVADIDDFGAASIVSGIMHAAEERGLYVAVRATKDDAAREHQILRSMRPDRLHGVILAVSRSLDADREAAVAKELDVLADLGARVVVIGDNMFHRPSVVVDNTAAATILAQGIAEQGRRRFAVVAGPADQVTAGARTEGFLRGLARNGIRVPARDIVHTDFSQAGGYQAGLTLARRRTRYDHIAAMSDAMAVGVIAGLRERGLQVPSDVEVSGFDHVPLLSDILPGFSTVELPLEEFGEAAVDLLFAPDDAGPRTVSLAAVPIVGGRRLAPVVGQREDLPAAIPV